MFYGADACLLTNNQHSKKKMDVPLMIFLTVIDNYINFNTYIEIDLTNKWLKSWDIIIVLYAT